MDILKLVLSKQEVSGLAHFFRYGLISGVSLAVDVSLLIIGREVFGLSYLLAATISFLVGVAVNYLLCLGTVFNSSRFKNRTVEFSLTLFIAGVGLAINSGVMWLMVTHFLVYYLVAKLVSSGIVFFWNFVVRKYYIHAT